MLRVAVIGYGYWGPNIVRNFSRTPSCSVSWVVDINKKTLRQIPLLYPAIRTTTRIEDALDDPAVTAVIIVTPPKTHFSLAARALSAGKHVLVEKPFTETPTQAKKLIALAKKKKKILMVDHTFVYTPAVRAIKELLVHNELGNVYYVDSVRTNLGIIQKDVNVVYDLAAHDFAIMEYLFDAIPKSVAASGIMQAEIHQETTAHITARYPKQLFFHTHVSWLSPVKIRTMIFVGTKKMLVYDDMEPSEKIKIYDKGISVSKNPKQRYQLRIGYRTGAALVPTIGIEEGLVGVVDTFLKSIHTNTQPATGGVEGLHVVSVLEAATRSLRKNGERVTV